WASILVYPCGVDARPYGLIKIFAGALEIFLMITAYSTIDEYFVITKARIDQLGERLLSRGVVLLSELFETLLIGHGLKRILRLREGERTAEKNDNCAKNKSHILRRFERKATK